MSATPLHRGPTEAQAVQRGRIDTSDAQVERPVDCRYGKSEASAPDRETRSGAWQQ